MPREQSMASKTPERGDATPKPPRLLIMACSASKRPNPAPMPARDRYDGPLWRTLRAVDPNGEYAAVAFLSAKFGFRGASTPIPAYDARLTEQLAQRMIEGGTTTRWPQPHSRRGLEGGIHAAVESASLARDAGAPFGDVALVGGHLYLRVMRAFLVDFRKFGEIAPDARIVQINGPIGRMRTDLAAWLRSGSRRIQP